MHGLAKNEIGNTYGELKVIQISHSNMNGVYWECLCSCGKTIVKNGSSLRLGRAKICCVTGHNTKTIIKPVYLCGNCKKPFSARRDRIKFCSRECAFQYKRKVSECKLHEAEAEQIKRCSYCGKEFMGRKRRCCSDKCNVSYYRRKRVNKRISIKCKCKYCGAYYEPSYGDKRRVGCSGKCTKKYNEQVRKDRERANKYRGAFEKIERPIVYERDGWVCQICGAPTHKTYNNKDMLSPTLDHIIPVSKGGAHVYDNVQCAHLLCNIRKSDAMW